jgi:hypothetical protein
MRLDIDRRRVVHETIDGEAILIHMETGFYYSLDGTGSEVWGAIVAGRTVDEIVAELRARYDASNGTIEESVSSLVAELLEEGLVVEATAAPTNGSHPAVAAHAPERVAADADREFAPPVLNRYTDMADFILVDPVHEVDETGWPERKPADEPSVGNRVT